MAIPTNAILKVVASLAFPDSVIAQNVFYVLFSNDGGSDDDDDVLDDLEDWVEDMWTLILAAMADDVTMDDIKVYIYDGVDDDFDEVGTRTTDVTFTSGDQYMPLGVAIVSNAKTTDPDVYGRKYWGGFTEAVNDDGHIAAGYPSDFALLAGEWITPFTGAASGSEFVPGVYSLTRQAFYAFNGVADTNLVWGYQRRRKPGVGI